MSHLQEKYGECIASGTFSDVAIKPILRGFQRSELSVWAFWLNLAQAFDTAVGEAKFSQELLTLMLHIKWIRNQERNYKQQNTPQ